jgi:DNA-binding ferritin-like protein (Dps family)
MKFWDAVTGSDISKEWNAFDARAEELPAEYRAAWDEIKGRLLSYSDFTGRNLTPILDGALGFLEETAADGLRIDEALGDDIAGFCEALAGNQGGRSHRDRWREQLNRNVAKKLDQLGG